MPRALVLCCAFVIAVPGVVRAEWLFTPLVGLTFKGRVSGARDWEDATSKVHKHFGGAVTIVRVGTIGLEGLFVDAPAFFKHDDIGLVDEGRSLALMGNLVVTAPRRWTEYTLRPFFSGGFGLMRINDVDQIGAFPVRENLAGFNLGGGAIGFFTKRTGVRFDLRYFRTLRPVEERPISINSIRVRYMTASIGIVIRR